MLDQVARLRRRTIRLPADLVWLNDLSPAPRRLLSQMVKRGLLHRAGEDRYVVAPMGTDSLEQAAPPELLIDLILQPHPYYIGFLSALITHRLTDLHSKSAYAAVPKGVRLRGRMPIDLEIAQLGPKAWPATEDELERFRTVEGTKEFAVRSTIERTLVDGLLRPNLCAGFETVVLAWSRAQRHPEVSWERVAQIGHRIGGSTAPRTAFMLNLVGLDTIAEKHLADVKSRRAGTPLDRSNGFALDRGNVERDPRTGVLLNVPSRYLRGWIDGEAFP